MYSLQKQEKALEPGIISDAGWLYYRFNLSHRDIDEVFVRTNGRQHYPWRAVDQDDEVVDVYLEEIRSRCAFPFVPRAASGVLQDFRL
jgi:transposase-like protein